MNSIDLTLLPTQGQSPLTHLGLIKVTGQDAVTFLQGQLSGDMSQIDAQRYQWADYANLQGRIVASMLCFSWEEAIYLRMARDLVDKTLTTLSKYAVFSKVTLEDVSSQIHITGLYGYEQPKLEGTHPEINHVASSPTRCCLRLPGPVPRFECYSPTPLALSLDTAPAEHWRLWDILAGIATIYAPTSELFLPHRINHHLIGAISFEKGCYLGQEIIARMHYRSELKHHAQIIQFEGQPLTQGATIQLAASQQKIGAVIDSVRVTDSMSLALVSVADSALSEATWQCDQQSLHYQQLELPYQLKS